MAKVITVEYVRGNKNSGGSRAFFQKLSKGLMLPVAVLPIAGLLLGLGAGFANILVASGVSADNGIFLVTTLMNKVGDFIFGNLPILFAVAIAVAFSEDAGTAALSGVVGWIAFNGTQLVFISNPYTLEEGQQAYNIFFYLNVPSSVVGVNIGITSLQTSVFGGMVIGAIAAGSYNKFHKTQLPTVLGFFQGVRMVPIVTLLLSVVAGFVFVIVWPIAGVLLDQLGRTLSGMPIGTDTFIYGTIGRLLNAFGLHHAFYTPLWFTSVGGQFLKDGQVVAEGNNYIWQFINGEHGTMAGLTFDSITSAPVVDGFNTLTIDKHVYQLTAGVSPSSYTQGGYPVMMFGLPAAAAAMIILAKKENRTAAASVLISAAATSFLTGITEPFEYTFLFLSPLLYVVHAIYEGLAYALMDIVGAHVGVSFSRGLIDLVVFGILPSATGNITGWWWVLVFGTMYIPLYFFTFYIWIKVANLQTPGRTSNDVSMITKAKYNKLKEKDNGKSDNDREKRVKELLKHLGGIKNLLAIDACITRLRLTIADRDKVNDEGLKKMGAAGIVGKGNAIQIIFGGEADIFKSELREIQKK